MPAAGGHDHGHVVGTKKSEGSGVERTVCPRGGTDCSGHGASIGCRLGKLCPGAHPARSSGPTFAKTQPSSGRVSCSPVRRHLVAACSAGGYVALDEGGVAFVGRAADAVGSCRELKVSHAGDIEF